MIFLKYYNIRLKNPDYNDIISWNEEGTAFVVKNINELAEKVNIYIIYKGTTKSF